MEVDALRNSKQLYFILVLILFLGFFVFPSIVKAQNDLLLGAWKQTEYLFTSPDTSFTNKCPQPSLHIFTPKYYSFMYVLGTEPRPLIVGDEARGGISDDLMRSIFTPFIANSGTYELDRTTLTIRPIVALSPNFMTGGSTKYEYKIDGTRLLLTWIWEAGTKEQLKLTRIE